MARWAYRRLVWTAAPPEGRELVRVRELLRRLDRDAPMWPGDNGYQHDPPYELPGLGPWGLASTWRAPLQPWPALLNVLDCFGYPCRGWELPYCNRTAWLAPAPRDDGHWPGWEEGYLAPTWPEPPHGCAWHTSAQQLAGVGLLDDDAARLARLSRRFGPFLPPRLAPTRHVPGNRYQDGQRSPGRWTRPHGKV